jgi:hypothetical protein
MYKVFLKDGRVIVMPDCKTCANDAIANDYINTKKCKKN